MRCSKCRIEKDASCFYSKSGICKPCVLAKMRARYQENRETINAQRRATAATPEKKAQRRSRQTRKSVETLARTRHKHRDDPRYQMLRGAKRRAGWRGLVFAIGPEDLTIPAVCPVLGIPIETGEGLWRSGSPTIDRVDNALGYVPGNVRVISYRANSLKRDATVDELKALVAYMERELKPTLKLVVG